LNFPTFSSRIEGQKAKQRFVAHLFQFLLKISVASLTVSATPDKSLSPRLSFSSGAEVLVPRTAAAGAADALMKPHLQKTK
jgi:hypothetical protein